jgi:uncharacterized membrane protein
MRLFKSSLGFLLSLPLLASPGADTRPVTFAHIDVPGAATTVAMGINASGEVVGSYTDVAGKVHGYVLSGGVFTTIDVPGAAGAEARGIGPGGDIVGDYWMTGEPAVNFHGFLLRRNGELVNVDYPLHTSAICQRILPDGTILGCYHDKDTMASMFGMWICGDREEAILQSASMHNGATPDLRLIAGSFTDLAEPAPRASWGYVIQDGLFTRFRVPGSNLTTAWDVSPDGAIVGVYRDAGGTHGYLLEDETYVAIDVPGASATRAFGINARGDIVGTYVDASGKTRGFLRREHRVSGTPAPLPNFLDR